MTSMPDSTTVGGDLTYTVTATNAGPDPATFVTIQDPLPKTARLVSVSATQGACAGADTITCELGELVSGASAALTIVVRTTAPGRLVNAVSIRGARQDLNAANNRAEVVTNVACTITGTATGDVLRGRPPTMSSVAAGATTRSALAAEMMSCTPAAGTTSSTQVWG